MHRLTGQMCGAMQRDAPRAVGFTMDIKFRAELMEHNLGMVAGRGRFNDDRVPCGIERGQQNSRFYLRGCNGQPVGEGPGLCGADDAQRHPAAVAAEEIRAHQHQRVHDAPHGPFAERGVAVEFAGDRVGGEQADEQPRRRAAVAHIQCGGRFLELTDAAAGNVPDPVRMSDHMRAQRPHRGGGVQDVFALQKPVNHGFSGRGSAQHQSAVRDAFVARRRDSAGQRSGAAGG